MKDKSEVFHLFVKFYRMIQTQFESPIKRLRSDNGREYVNQNLSKFLEENGVVHELTCVDTPQQNGVAERKNRHLLEVTRALLFQTSVPRSYWGEAVLTATYLINRLPSRVLEGVTPIQVMTTFYPSIPMLNSLQNRVFGCPAFVHVHSPYRGKLDPRAIKCVFIGYAPNKKGYKCYHPQSRKVYISKDVTFHETESFFPSSQLQGESIQEAEDLELPPFPLLQDFVLREDDKDPAPTSLPEKNNEDKYFGKQYQRRQQEPVLVEQQLQLSEPEVSLDAFERKYMTLELELVNAQKGRDANMEKLRELEEKCSQLEQNEKKLEEKLMSLEDENRVLRQKALSTPLKSNRPGFAKSISDKYSSAITSRTERKTTYESPTPTKLIAPFTLGLTDSRRSKLTAEKHQDNYEFLSKCIKENLGFKNGKPIAARIIYKCLLHWHSFESERTTIFDSIIEGINEALKVRVDDIILPYWLSNTTALLCLLQRNLRSNGFLTTTSQRYPGSSGLTSRTGHGPKSPLQFIGFDDGVSHVEARYPAILFKQQLTACVEKIFGLLRDNLKKELSPLLASCIQAPKTGRGMQGAKLSRSPRGIPQQSSSGPWDNIVKFLDSLMSKLRGNHVPSFFIRKLVTQVFSFINITLFNSLLLRRECCTFSNGEYVKSGLAELEKWIVNAKEEYAGTSWHELNYIRQAVGFLVIHQKRKKSLEEIRKDLCPALTVRQIYVISLVNMAYMLYLDGVLESCRYVITL
ncbi:myosin-15-like isoform X2 [Phaseolus vulgaris]|uniref:myosin-15-like isoform X2 n=1 Tax=Phaseolus vulgaris TaxID=3885 RepID=UPI0035CBA76F